LKTALDIGIKSFFGLDDDFKPVGAVQYPGHLVVMSRALVRSATQIVLAFKDLVELMGSGNIVSGILQLLEIIDVIRSSRIISAINIFSKIGDSQLTISEKQDYDSTISIDNGLKISLIDNLKDTEPLAAVSKSRLRGIATQRDGTLKLAWSTNRTPSLLSIPSSKAIFSTEHGLALNGGLLKAENDPVAPSRTEYATQEQLSATGRISDEAREQFEEKFESEYLPFYFHDLRTNEIVGFHAFLMSLNDDYSAEYEETMGFGRIEPIKSYRATKRKISLSFMIAALDEKDFNSMWEKINKLTTLVYPQYTKGRIYDNAETGYRFEKPFTQQIHASPMIRLRVGNLFASNYSRFNLAGIFGLYDNDARLNGKSLNIDSALEDGKRMREDRNAAIDNFDRDFSKYYVKGYEFNLKKIVYTPKPASAAASSTEKPPAPSTAVQKSPTQEPDLASLDLSSGKYPIDNFKFVIDRYYPETNIVNGKIQQVKLTKISTPLANLLKETFSFDISGLGEMTPDTKTKHDNARKKAVAAGVAAGAAKVREEVIENVKSFMSDTGSGANTIAKSFRSTGGKGLAGFIDQMTFDWYERTTWDLDTGRKVPKMCKVTITFTPVHDIYPGLGADGHNRAPIYPVGPYAKRKA